MPGRPITQERTRNRNMRDFKAQKADEMRSFTQLRWQDSEELEKAVRKYFKDCDRRKVSYTTTGLAMWLGFERRQTLANYAQREDELGSVMRRAQLRIEQQRAEQLVDSAETPPQAKIFDLKCNFGWQEPPQQQEINNPDGNLGNKVVAVLPERPPSLEEWQSWYQQMMSSRSDPEPIDADYTEGSED